MVVTDLIPGEVRKDLKMKEVQLEPEGRSFFFFFSRTVMEKQKGTSGRGFIFV